MEIKPWELLITASLLELP